MFSLGNCWKYRLCTKIIQLIGCTKIDSSESEAPECLQRELAVWLFFLKLPYHITLWQLILMLVFYCDQKRRRNMHLKFTWKMPEVVANFLCKLLDTRAIDNLKVKMEEAKNTTNRWTKGQPQKLVKGCQDKWCRGNQYSQCS